MKLYLVRHATAADIAVFSPRSDAERPLTEHGKKEARAVAAALKESGVKGQLFLSSPLVRARQTASIFAEIFAAADKLEICPALAPGGSTDILFKQLNDHRKISEAFLFGHQPDMTSLAQYLLQAEVDISFKKAGVARIDVSDLPPTRAGALKWYITPKLIGVG